MLLVLILAAAVIGVHAEPPAVPVVTQWADWPMAFTADSPGALSAANLLDKPAGRLGPVTVHGDHFFTGNRRIRFWGVNFAFAACFPTHDEADAVAQRLAAFGINAVRIHHADNQPFPSGIWADRLGERMSPEALDRLDYLIAALKKQGIYTDLNLHVSRDWSKSHKWENADQLPEGYDKIIDVIHPDLIAANKQYARELLGHVNAYTNTRYADEPAICFVEINNEDTLFLWGAEGKIAKLPEPYGGMLKSLWNQWLAKKYPTRDKLKSAWTGDGAKKTLADDEDPAKATVASHAPGAGESKPRSADWFDFLQQTDERYWLDMRDFLKKDLGVKCPITGTIGLGPLGTLSQSKMDFVDAHAYWDHPKFPHRQWDMRDWQIKNDPMVDVPERATLWSLAATRVKGKPFTVTEYNHAAPNEWQAECVPMIAAYAALQDWDGVFLFAYSHGLPYDKQKMASFFDIEGNPLKMAQMPLASRLFLSQRVRPIEAESTIYADHDEMLRTGSQFYYQIWPWARSHNLTWQDVLVRKLSIDFNFNRHATPSGWSPPDERIGWTSAGPNTGAFTFHDDRAALFIGFAPKEPLDLGPLRIEKLDSPFLSLMLIPADPAQTLDSADHLLLSIVARAQNQDMQWDESHHSVADHWGKAPPQVEVVKGRISLGAGPKVELYPLTPDGQRGKKLATEEADGRLILPTGSAPTIWYELAKK
jgi:hypothetical protein